MPNLDSGRYFLTTLFPIRNGPYVDVGEGDEVMQLLPVQAVRHVLSVGATAQQGPATYWTTAKNGKRMRATNNSHFAKNLRTHFTRIFVLNNAVYNGRNLSDVVLDTIRGLPFIGRLFGKKTNLLEMQSVDQLSNPYLVWVVEIDAPEAKEEELDTYLEELWQQMEDKLKELFVHCHGFDAANMNARKFVEFVRLGQIETVMPFNDYWQTAPSLPTFFETGHATTTKIVAGLGGLATVIALLGFLYHLIRWIGWGGGGTGWWLGFFVISLIVTVILTVWLAYSGIMKFGNRGFPMAPKSDLPSVLKALYLQQKTLGFAVDNQGCNAEQLRRNFGEFLAEHQPENVGEPTQQAGTISS